MSANCGVITIEFTNTSTDANSYSWDFGGLQSSSETSPTLSFTAGAPINATLSATNPSGTDTASQSVSLTDNSSSFTVIMELQPDCFAGELSWSFLDPNDVEIDGQNTGDINSTALTTLNLNTIPMKTLYSPQQMKIAKKLHGILVMAM